MYLGPKDGLNHRVDLLRDLETRPLGRFGRTNYVHIREIDTRLRKYGPKG